MVLTRPKSNAVWREVWLKKLETAFTAKGLQKSVLSGFDDFINRFLSPHSCHPGQIPVQAIHDFCAQNGKSNKQSNFCRDALRFFYTNVVQSENHIRALDDFPVKARAKRPRQKRK
jgi:hypothetical protein